MSELIAFIFDAMLNHVLDDTLKLMGLAACFPRQPDERLPIVFGLTIRGSPEIGTGNRAKGKTCFAEPIFTRTGIIETPLEFILQGIEKCSPVVKALQKEMII